MAPKLIAGLRAITERKPFFLVALALLFILSFALPMVFAIKVGGFMYDTEPREPEEGANALFPNTVRVAGANNFISVPDSELLDPKADKDFLLVLWVRLKKLPADGERMLLLAKYDAEARGRPGYALALTREGEVVRPEVYWRDEKNGTWLKFSEIALAPRAWVMFALSFREQKLLGLHSATVVEHLKPSLKVLGGYELEKNIIPHSDSPLLVGSFTQGKFRGKIGTIGVMQRSGLSNDLGIILENILAVPTKIPPQFDEEDVGLWTVDGRKDEVLKHKVEFLKEGSDDSE